MGIVSEVWNRNWS